MLDLLKMPPQEDRDAVMILHLGGVFGDKAATLDRFRANYAGLADNVKKRLVLENDDVSWSVHELLPICEELNIPMVLDYHHHNIIFDETQIREGTKDIMDLYPRILATWKKKNITPKMHYSEPTPAAITGRQRRKHSPRVATLPPCPPDMDLMIEAKDKEQAVFELMRTFKLPGYDKFNDILPHVRNDDNKIPNTPKKKKKDAEPEPERPIIPDDEVGMGGPEGRVYWPPGMEDWLRPVKRVVKKKEPGDTPAKSPAKKKAAAKDASETAVKLEAEIDEDEDTQPALTKGAKKAAAEEAKETKAAAKKAPAKKPAAKKAAAKKAPKKAESTPELTEESEAEEELSDLSDSASTPPTPPPKAKGGAAARAVPARPSRSQKRVSYVESQDDI
jgi:UV DNA damage endonuclease